MPNNDWVWAIGIVTITCIYFCLTKFFAFRQRSTLINKVDDFLGTSAPERLKNVAYNLVEHTYRYNYVLKITWFLVVETRTKGFKLFKKEVLDTEESKTPLSKLGSENERLELLNIIGLGIKVAFVRAPLSLIFCTIILALSGLVDMLIHNKPSKAECGILDNFIEPAMY